MVFRPIAYDPSTPSSPVQDAEEEIREEEEAADTMFLQPRTFSPLITSPSPTLSAVTTNPPPTEPPQSPTSTIRSTETSIRPRVPTISLKQAQRANQAPGAVHLLPEELRAQNLEKSKSKPQLRPETMSIFSAGAKAPLQSPKLPPAIVFPDLKRAISKPAASPSFANAFPVGKEPVREMVSYFQESSKQNDGSESDEPRGRTMQRRSLQYQQQLNANPPDFSDKIYSPSYSDEKIVNDIEYNDFAPEAVQASQSSPLRQPSSSPGGGYSSDDSIRTHMKLVPQPLFQGKQPPSHSRKLSEGVVSSRASNTGTSVSPFSTFKRVKSDDSSNFSSASGRSARSSSGFGLRLSSDTPREENMGRASNNSSTGMIPISPPDQYEPLPRSQDSIMKKPKVPKIDTSASRSRRSSSAAAQRRKKSESKFYPHVMSRNKPKKPKKSEATVTAAASGATLPTVSPGKPLLATEIIAQALKTPPESSPQSPSLNSPLGSHPVAVQRTTSHGSSEKGTTKKPLLLRIAQRARRKSSQQDPHISPPMASPSSPHLFPSPTSSNSLSKPKTPLATYLGWSDASKTTFDEAHSPVTSVHHLRVTHVVAPAKPLDASKGGLGDQEPESPTSTAPRRPSIFGGVLDSWRENKAQRRREDLKKLIRVVGPGEEGKTSMESANAAADGAERAERPGLLQMGRRLSSYGWT